MSKKKKVNFKLIADTESEAYNLLAEARENWHGDLHEARIALAWQLRIKADTDGHVLLGKCIKVSDLTKEFTEFDFIITLNREVWDSAEFDKDRKLALLDHELCHAEVAYDEETGSPKYDERDRPVFRIRRHDIEEFRSVVEHHGCYKRDLEEFARTLLRKPEATLFSPRIEREIAGHVGGMIPEDGGIDSLTISVPSTGSSVTITKEDAKAMREYSQAGVQ